jgi:hypothetical protein
VPVGGVREGKTESFRVLARLAEAAGDTVALVLGFHDAEHLVVVPEDVVDLLRLAATGFLAGQIDPPGRDLLVLVEVVLTADQVFVPACGVQSGIDELRAGVGLVVRLAVVVGHRTSILPKLLSRSAEWLRDQGRNAGETGALQPLAQCSRERDRPIRRCDRPTSAIPPSQTPNAEWDEMHELFPGRL